MIGQVEELGTDCERASPSPVWPELQGGSSTVSGGGALAVAFLQTEASIRPSGSACYVL